MKFIWDDHFSVNVRMIDEQHRHYFDIVNRLYDMLDDLNVDKSVLGGILKELVDYAFYHLQTEEQYFREFDFEGAVHHVAMHDVYRSTMKEYMMRLDASDVDVKKLFDDIAKFAIDWFTNHIMVEDKKYSHCFNEHGLK